MLYTEIGISDLDTLPRDRTVFTLAVSPIEVHGEHLPLGTDILVAEHVMERFIDELSSDWTVVKLPTLWIGVDPLPAKGSIPFKPSALESALVSVSNVMRSMGFRYLVVFDNHGGPRHQLAEYDASLKMLKKGFYTVVPFLHIFKEMVEDDEKLPIGRGANGDLDDLHAGTNETSILMRIRPDLVADHRIHKKYIPDETLSGKILKMLTGDRALARLIDWISSKENPKYIGDPSKADPENGEKMLNYHLKRSLEEFQKAVNGTYKPEIFLKPISRFLLRIF